VNINLSICEILKFLSHHLSKASGDPKTQSRIKNGINAINSRIYSILNIFTMINIISATVNTISIPNFSRIVTINAIGFSQVGISIVRVIYSCTFNAENQIYIRGQVTEFACGVTISNISFSVSSVSFKVLSLILTALPLIQDCVFSCIRSGNHWMEASISL